MVSIHLDYRKEPFRLSELRILSDYLATTSTPSPDDINNIQDKSTIKQDPNQEFEALQKSQVVKQAEEAVLSEVSDTVDEEDGTIVFAAEGDEREPKVSLVSDAATATATTTSTCSVQR